MLRFSFTKYGHEKRVSRSSGNESENEGEKGRRHVQKEAKYTEMRRWRGLIKYLPEHYW